MRAMVDWFVNNKDKTKKKWNQQLKIMFIQD
jgi:hypothetical protein